MIMPVLRRDHEPTDAELNAGDYPKRRILFARMRIAIENEAGTVRRGVDRGGKRWEVRMLFPYGEVCGSCGVDGDPVDCYLGPDPHAPFVYVVHQRKAGRWDEYDEDKCMIGFASEEEAKAAYLKHYNDPRFLGPVTAMPVDEFRRKVRATADDPAMIKAVALMAKARVSAHDRRLPDGRVVHVDAYNDRRPSRTAQADDRQLALFAAPPPKPPPFSPEVAAHPERHTPDLFTGETLAEREKKKPIVAMLREEPPKPAWHDVPLGAAAGEVGTITHRGETFKLMLKPQGSSVRFVVSKGKDKEAIGAPLDLRVGRTLGGAIAYLESLLSKGAKIDVTHSSARNAKIARDRIVEGQSGSVRVTRDGVDVTAEALAKVDAAQAAKGEPDHIREMRAKLRRLKSASYRTDGEDKLIDLYERVLAADPSKWKIGDGVKRAVIVNGNVSQWNRGYRIVDIDSAGKLAKIRQVADTGLTESGGNSDRFKDEWIYLGKLKRDNAFSAAQVS